MDSYEPRQYVDDIRHNKHKQSTRIVGLLGIAEVHTEHDVSAIGEGVRFANLIKS